MDVWTYVKGALGDVALETRRWTGDRGDGVGDHRMQGGEQHDQADDLSCNDVRYSYDYHKLGQV